MGDQEGCIGQPSGDFLNGLLSNGSTPVTCALDSERWLMAEERTAKLIACIQPNGPSEERRNAVAEYVQRLIMKCFHCQVFTFGSVPLKTYLPDGDIDLTVFSNNPSLKDTWATVVRDILESEEKNENAEFCVKEVQYIQAEVKIIKCLVENIVVDISFNQLGGLCTLCFLEEVDNLIQQNFLFKRSIILIKAWCYYESRILGAHHGLISTYALETLVLYIFHVFNNSFAGPLEVLYRFLEFFSNFDWDNCCISLWGPVPIRSLPDVTPDPPRKDGAELLLDKGFLEKCHAAYADFAVVQENQGQPFMSKHFNIIDPLRVNNNLGRSVSKGNFFRIRSAFAYGAKRLAKLLYCPKEDVLFELNQFFMNTWERHGSGIRPDAPLSTSPLPVPSYIEQSQGKINNSSLSRQKKMEISSAHESALEVSEHSSQPSENRSGNSSVSSNSRPQTQNENANLHSSRKTGQTEKGRVDRSMRSIKLGNNEYVQGKYLFARTRSSPELTETYADTSSSQVRRKKATVSTENQTVSTKTDTNRRKNGRSGSVSTKSNVSVEDSEFGNMSEERASVAGAQGMIQEEQDLVNMISSPVNNFGGQFPLPLNFSSAHLPIPISPSMLASLGYAPRNLAGLMPGNISLLDPAWASNMHFAQGSAQHPLPFNFSGIGLGSNSEDRVDSAEVVSGDGDDRGDVSSSGRFVPGSCTFFPTGPPVPFVMYPFYNLPSDGSSTREEGGLNSSVSIQSLDSFDGIEESKALNASIPAGGVSLEETRDILDSDFRSHFQNLLYGRSCQNHVVFPSPVIVPPGYLQGRFPWNGPGRPLGANANMLPQVMTYSPRMVPVPPVQPVSDAPIVDYPRYVEDMPRYRAGTGTYLPSPKPIPRDRNSSGSRRNNYNFDRNDHRGDRDGNWNASKSRAANRGQNNRNQTDKSNSRIYRQTLNESRAERPWSSHSHESQNGPLHSSSSDSGSANVAYGTYQVTGMNPNRVASNGPSGSPVVMYYPYDNDSGYSVSPGEPVELGSIGPMGFVGSNEVAQHVMEGARARKTLEEQRFHGTSQRSSPDQPSSPHLHRRS